MTDPVEVEFKRIGYIEVVKKLAANEYRPDWARKMNALLIAEMENKNQLAKAIAASKERRKEIYTILGLFIAAAGILVAYLRVK